MKKAITIKNVLWLSIAIFIILITFFFAPIFQEKRAYFPIIAVLGLIFLILGIVLIVLTIKQKIKGKKKLFLLLTGISAITPFAGSILHNLLYALGILAKNIAIIKYTAEFLHVAFFLIALIVGPLAFIVGAVASIILIKRGADKKAKK